MYHVYILKSRKNDSLYIGYTNNVTKRLKEHNNGKVGYTRKYKPWRIIYYESYISLDDTKRREKSLKYFGKAYGQLKKRIKNSLNT